MDQAELELLEDALRKAMTATAGGAALDGKLAELGWPDMLAAYPDAVIPLVFRLLGETGAHAPILNDVVLSAAGRAAGDVVPLPYAGGAWIRWERSDRAKAPDTGALDGELPLRKVPAGAEMPLTAGRRALGWWLVGTSRAMLALARRHAVERTQFGKPIAAFQAVRHRLAETLVAIEGAEATLTAATPPATGVPAETGTAPETETALSSLLAKASAGQAARTAARHCQQVLGGIGFTAEHELHRHVRRVLVLDGLLGSSRELTREAGALLRARGTAPRLVHL